MDSSTTTTTAKIQTTNSLGQPLPRVTIAYCTQCRWMLRAAYLAQELLSTFSDGAVGEVALRPARGGLFRVAIETGASSDGLLFYTSEQLDGVAVAEGDPTLEPAQTASTRTVILWDRKLEGGFPETKLLKQRVRDVISPGRDLGHSDVGGKKAIKTSAEVADQTSVEDRASDTKQNGDSNANEEQSKPTVASQPQGRDNCETCP